MNDFEWAVGFGRNRSNIAIAVAEATERGDALTLPEAQDVTDISATTVRTITKTLTDQGIFEETTKSGRMAFRLAARVLPDYRAWRDAGATTAADEHGRELAAALKDVMSTYRVTERADPVQLARAYGVQNGCEDLAETIISAWSEGPGGDPPYEAFADDAPAAWTIVSILAGKVVPP
jgi:hypothetical protein